MTEDLVTIGHFSSETRAELVRAYLLAYGIDAVLQDLEASRLKGVVALVFDVQLQVRAGDASAAARLLADWEREEAARRARGQGAEERCLACGAPLAPADTRCAACGWTWEERRPT